MACIIALNLSEYRRLTIVLLVFNDYTIIKRLLRCVPDYYESYNQGTAVSLAAAGNLLSQCIGHTSQLYFDYVDRLKHRLANM